MFEHQDLAVNNIKNIHDIGPPLWKKLSNELNTFGPPTRSVKTWKKVWADYKYNSRKKLDAFIKIGKPMGTVAEQVIICIGLQDKLNEHKQWLNNSLKHLENDDAVDLPKFHSDGQLKIVDVSTLYKLPKLQPKPQSIDELLCSIVRPESDVGTNHSDVFNQRNMQYESINQSKRKQEIHTDELKQNQKERIIEILTEIRDTHVARNEIEKEKLQLQKDALGIKRQKLQLQKEDLELRKQEHLKKRINILPQPNAVIPINIPKNNIFPMTLKKVYENRSVPPKNKLTNII